MSVTIDSLNIEIASDSKKASDGIETLIATLKELRQVCTGGANLGEVASGLKDLNNELKKFNAKRATKAFDEMKKSTDNAKESFRELIISFVRAKDAFSTPMGLGSNSIVPVTSWYEKIDDPFDGYVKGTGRAYQETKLLETGLFNVDKELKQKPKDAKKAANGFKNLSKETKKTSDALASVRQKTKDGQKALNTMNRQMKNLFPVTSKATKGMHTFLGSLKRIIMYRAIYSFMKLIEDGLSQGVSNAYQFARIMGQDVATSMNTVSANFYQMQNQLGAMSTQLIQTLAPVLIKIANTLNTVFDRVTEAVAAFNGENQYMKANLVGKVWEDAKDSLNDYKKALSGLDELNVIDKQENRLTYDYKDLFTLTEVSESAKQTGKIVNDVMDALTEMNTMVYGCEVAIGALLAITGINIPLGLGLVAHGGWNITQQALDFDWANSTLDEKITEITKTVGAAEMAFGAILALSGVSIGLGLFMVADGFKNTGYSTLKQKWDKIPEKTQNAITSIAEIVGVGMVAVGALLAFSGTSVGLGIAMMISGGVTSVQAKKLKWNKNTEKIGSSMDSISEIIMGVSAAMIAIGALLCFTGVGTGLGLGLLIAGGVGLGSEVALNWDAILEQLKGAWENIKKWWNKNVAPVFTKAYWQQKWVNITDSLKEMIGSVETVLNTDLNGDGSIGFTINADKQGSRTILTHIGMMYDNGTLGKSANGTYVNASTSQMYANGYYANGVSANSSNNVSSNVLADAISEGVANGLSARNVMSPGYTQASSDDLYLILKKKANEDYQRTGSVLGLIN